MEISDKLISRFFENKCTADEAAAVADYLKENPKVQERFLNKSEWDAVKDLEDSFPDELTSDMWVEINKKTTTPVYAIFKRIAIAASIIMVLGCAYILGSYLFKQPAVIENTLTTTKKIIAPEFKIVINKETIAKKVLLPDGSVVMLAPNSRFEYAIDLRLKYRSIKLDGSAMFKVAKDKSRPFTVYSGTLATTALGTKFYVSNPKGATQIMVSLFEGKVAVKTNIGNNAAVKTYYLLPGSKIIYDPKTMLARILNFELDKRYGISNKKELVNWFMFNNDSLTVTLDQLAAIYNVPIKYSVDDLKRISFIGKIRRTDSLADILNDISSLNNLLLIKDGKGYIIQKKKK